MSPKSKEQYEEIRQRSAALILQAALELFGHNGYHSTSISQIAKEAGVSKGLIYNYYSGKEALLDAIVVGAMQVGEGLMEENLEVNEPPADRLQHLIESTFGMVRNNLHYWKLMTSLAFQPEVVDKYEMLLKAKSEETFARIEALFVEMKIPQAKEEAYFLGAMLDGVMLHYMNLGDNYPLDKMIAFTVQKFCRQ